MERRKVITISEYYATINLCFVCVECANLSMQSKPVTWVELAIGVDSTFTKSRSTGSTDTGETLEVVSATDSVFFTSNAS